MNPRSTSQTSESDSRRFAPADIAAVWIIARAGMLGAARTSR
ncbi:hypothetical protein [Acidocella sp.]